MIWFGWVLVSTIVAFFNQNSFLYILIRYTWIGLVGFYGISTIVGYLMTDRVKTYIKYAWFGWIWVLVYQVVWVI